MFGKTQKRLRELEREVKDLKSVPDKRTIFDTLHSTKQPLGCKLRATPSNKKEEVTP